MPPGGGEGKKLAGVGVFFTLSLANDGGEIDQGGVHTKKNKSESSTLYTSEVVRDTLNPDWAPFEDKLVNAAQLNGENVLNAISPPHQSMTLRVFFIPAPNIPGSALLPTHHKSVVQAFVCTVSLGELISVPGGARGQRLVNLSLSGGRARAGAVLSAPPNTPLLRLRQGEYTFGDDGIASENLIFPGALGGALGTSIGDSGDDHNQNPMNPHGGWVVPVERAWPNLIEASSASMERQNTSATEMEASLTGDLVSGFARDSMGISLHVKKATTRQLSVATEAVIDANARLKQACSTRQRLRQKVGGNLGAERSTTVSSTGLVVSRNVRLNTRTPGGGSELITAKNESLRTEISKRTRLLNRRKTSIAERAASLQLAQVALEAAQGRLRDADQVLEGPYGLGRLHQEQRKLCARRWRLVSDLSNMFPVRAFGELIDQEDAHFQGKESTEDRNVASEDTDTYAQTVSHSKTQNDSPLTIVGVPLDHVSRPGQVRPIRSDVTQNSVARGTTNSPYNSQSQQSTLLNDPESAAAALGYVTQATLQLASILDVPLRYPVAPGASRSYICDLQQVFEESGDTGRASVSVPSGSNAGELPDTAHSMGQPPLAFDQINAQRSSANYQPNSSTYRTAKRGVWRRVEFPLFAEHAEGTRFAYAVFLLNKDLEQLLNAHGMLAVGPRHTLPNLKRLFQGVKKKVIST